MKLALIYHSCKIIYKSVRQIFRKIGKCDILPIFKIAQNLSYRFFQNFGCGRGSPLKFNCKSFIIGCTVGFRENPDQNLAFTTSEANQIARTSAR